MNWVKNTFFVNTLNNLQVDGFREKLNDVFSLAFFKAFAISGGLFFMVQFNGISILAMFMAKVFKVSEAALQGMFWA